MLGANHVCSSMSPCFSSLWYRPTHVHSPYPQCSLAYHKSVWWRVQVSVINRILKNDSSYHSPHMKQMIYISIRGCLKILGICSKPGITSGINFWTNILLNWLLLWPQFAHSATRTWSQRSLYLCGRLLCPHSPSYIYSNLGALLRMLY